MPLHSSGTYFTDDVLRKIFSFESEISDRLISRENSKLEFKEAFNLGSADEYAKTAAAFANAQGGYIVFGVKDSPRQMIGLKSQNFETFDSGKLALILNERFSPEIDWESCIWEIRGYKVGLLHFAEAMQKPVVCTKGGTGLQPGSIYYRYRGRSEAIRYPEIRRILEEEKSRERNLWIKQLKKMADVGVGQVGILDLDSGEVTGAKGNFYISDELLPKLQFLREGHFVEDAGAPALRLIGDLQAAEGPMMHSTIRIPTSLREPEIIGAFLRRESVLSPTDYVKAICFEQSFYFPLYFFIQQTNESIEEAIELINSLEVNGKVRDKIVSRLQLKNENLAIGKLTGSGEAAMGRRYLLDRIRQKTIGSDDFAKHQVRFFEAITHTDAASFDEEYIFSLFLENVLPSLTHLRSNALTTFRKAICHLDLEWYRNKIA
jgi:hypothetical protein